MAVAPIAMGGFLKAALALGAARGVENVASNVVSGVGNRALRPLTQYSTVSSPETSPAFAQQVNEHAWRTVENSRQIYANAAEGAANRASSGENALALSSVELRNAKELSQIDEAKQMRILTLQHRQAVERFLLEDASRRASLQAQMDAQLTPWRQEQRDKERGLAPRITDWLFGRGNTGSPYFVPSDPELR